MTLKAWLRDKVDHAVQAQGYKITRTPDREMIGSALRLLKPVKTEHQLIRIGGNGDGGYLVPDDLAGITACFSPDVSDVAEFEREIIERGIRSFQIDASVKESPLNHPLNVFERKFLGIQNEAEYIALDDWVDEKVGDDDGDLILQMDIEGAEWSTLTNASHHVLKRFRVIVLELHGLENIAISRFAYDLYYPVLERLARFFDVIHLHANNYSDAVSCRYFDIPPLLEVTYLKKDRSAKRTNDVSLPHLLDRKNVPGRPLVTVPLSLLTA